MVKRSSSQVALEILHRLLVERTMSQNELAREIGVRSDTIRKTLEHLRKDGVPLTREEEGRYVYWSVPESWVPGGVVISAEDARDLVRLLARSPREKHLQKLERRLVAAALDEHKAKRLELIHPAAQTAFEEGWATIVYQALMERHALRIKYYTMDRGELAWRTVSVAMEVPPLRMVARCHRSNTLKWFRLDNIHGAKLELGEDYRDTPRAEAAAFIAASVGNFNANEPVAEHAFLVRRIEGRWVERNLPSTSFRREDVDTEQLRFVVQSSGLLTLARYVLSLGPAARAESPALKALVRALAADVLAST